MQAITFVGAALVALAPLVSAGGNAVIVNKCDFDVYLWSISSDSGSGSPTMIPSGSGTISQAFEKPSAGGMSLKLANSTSGSVTQFEYTLADNIYYDMSNIDCNANGCPFQEYGMSLEAGSSCPSVDCPAGQVPCDQAYNQPDDVRTLACDLSCDLTLTLCDGSDSGSSPSESASSSPAPSSTTEASSIPEASSTPAPTTTSVAETTTTSVASYAASSVAQETTITTTQATTTESVGGWWHGHGYTAAPKPRRNVHHPHARRF